VLGRMYEGYSALVGGRYHRIIHRGEWEPKASYRLSSEFGIRP